MGDRVHPGPAGGGEGGRRGGMGDRAQPPLAGGADHGLRRLLGERPRCARHLRDDLDVVHALLRPLGDEGRRVLGPGEQAALGEVRHARLDAAGRGGRGPGAQQGGGAGQVAQRVEEGRGPAAHVQGGGHAVVGEPVQGLGVADVPMGVDQPGEQGGALAVHDPGAGRVGADQRSVDHHGLRLPQALAVEDADVGQGGGGARGHTGLHPGWAYGGRAGAWPDSPTPSPASATPRPSPAPARSAPT